MESATSGADLVTPRSYVREAARNTLPSWLYPSLYNLYWEVNMALLHRRGQRQARRYLNRNALRLNVGCGSNVKEGWLNIDLFGGCDLHLDLRRDLPFRTGSASIVYTEHFFEHLEYPHEAMNFLN